jgi:curved DNA-binding protein CbpA
MALYALLGVEKSASAKEIKKVYRELSKIHHPDKGGDEEKFKEIAEAYKILSDEKTRAKYDSGTSLEELKGETDDLIGRVFSVFEETIGGYGFVPEHSDLFKMMRATCNEKELKMDRDIENAKLDIRNITAVQDRMKHAEIFKEYLHNKIKSKKSTIVSIEDEKGYIRRILGFIESCEYVVDKDLDDSYMQGRIIREYGAIHGNS